MPIAMLRGVTLDCADPRALARFYRELTGMQLGYDADDFVALTDNSGCDLGFNGSTDTGPRGGPARTCRSSCTWDLRVEDLDAAEKLAVGFGAVRPDHQPGGDRWRVLLDPAGHPFCLVVG